MRKSHPPKTYSMNYIDNTGPDWSGELSSKTRWTAKMLSSLSHEAANWKCVESLKV